MNRSEIDISTYGKFYSFVFNGTYIANDTADTGSGLNRLAVQKVAGLFIVCIKSVFNIKLRKEKYEI